MNWQRFFIGIGDKITTVIYIYNVIFVYFIKYVDILLSNCISICTKICLANRFSKITNNKD